MEMIMMVHYHTSPPSNIKVLGEVCEGCDIHETILKRQHQMRDRINQHYTPRHSMIVDIFDRNNITPTPVPPEAPPYTLERENSPILNIADFSSVLINKNQAKRIDDIILSRIKNPCAAIFDGDNQYDVGFSSDLQLFMGTYERNNYEKKIMEENQFRMIDYEVFLVKRVNKNDRIG
ncbi:14987_t:CDS:2 [Rhizophagus irregularis]|nr:14987_t:CDS:2 [Rhizophagus irregularis]